MRTNEEIARQLQVTARTLTAQKQNLYRVRAYRRAAETILRLDRTVADLLREEGKNYLSKFSGIGKHLVETISHYAETGEWKMYTEL